MEKAHGREEGEGEGEGGIEGDLSFLRGTICSDKRLDLCKQVIGPGGIEPLMASLLIDASRFVVVVMVVVDFCLFLTFFSFILGEKGH